MAYYGKNKNNTPLIESELISELSRLAGQTLQPVNNPLVLLFWEIGFKINETILHKKLAENGRDIVPALSVELKNKFGRNFEEKNLRRMRQFADQFADKEIVVTLSRELTWAHFSAIIPIKNTEARLFYANEVNDLLMSVRDLEEKIAAKTFEGNAAAKF